MTYLLRNSVPILGLKGFYAEAIPKIAEVIRQIAAIKKPRRR